MSRPTPYAISNFYPTSPRSSRDMDESEHSKRTAIITKWTLAMGYDSTPERIEGRVDMTANVSGRYLAEALRIAGMEARSGFEPGVPEIHEAAKRVYRSIHEREDRDGMRLRSEHA